MKPTASEPPETNSDCSWLLFGATSAAFLVPLWPLSYITVYTQGEVMQGFFQLLVTLVAICATVGFCRRRWGVWILVVCGGLLVSWQSFQVRKWAMLHEDIQGFVRHAESYKAEHGDYPASIADYEFSHEITRSHIHGA